MSHHNQILQDLERAYLQYCGMAYIAVSVKSKSLTCPQEILAREKGYGAHVDFCVSAPDSIDALINALQEDLKVVADELIRADQQGVLAGKYFGLVLAGGGKVEMDCSAEILEKMPKLSQTEIAVLKQVAVTKSDPMIS